MKRAYVGKHECCAFHAKILNKYGNLRAFFRVIQSRRIIDLRLVNFKQTPILNVMILKALR
jgi:hypothetical protein